MINKGFYLILLSCIIFLCPIQINAESIFINTDNVNIRSGPSTDYEIISFVNQGESFQVLSETEDWYEISNEELSGYIYKEHIESTKQPVKLQSLFKDKIILIDAGHGGHDVGAIGSLESFEKNITYSTALVLKRELISLGANVYLTRENDDFISLEARSAYSNINDTDVFISLHYNSFPEQPDVNGIETYYFHDQHKKLAQYIQQGLIEKTNAKNRGISKGNYYVLRQNFKPSVLLELGFISNQEVENLLQTNYYQKQLVSGIISGLQKYFSY